MLAAVSLANMAALAGTLPTRIGGVVIWAQNDKPGSAADKALRRAVAEHQAAGRTVKLARIPPHLGKDINDAVRKGTPDTETAGGMLGSDEGSPR